MEGRITQLRLLQKGAENPDCSLVPSCLPVGTMCSESVTIKSATLKTGAVQALSPPEDFFCKLLCSLQETLGMLLGINEERKPPPYIIQKMLEELLRSRKQMGFKSTIGGRAQRAPFPDKCAQLQKSERWSLNKHSLCITLCELRAGPEGIYSP